MRRSCAGASRLPEMLVPPPKGMSTASASSAARRTAATSSSSARADDHVRAAGRARRGDAGRGRAGSCRERGPPGRADRSTRSRSPTASSSAADRSGDSDGSGILRPSKAAGREVSRVTSRSRLLCRNGPRAGLSSWENETLSSPHPDHFIAAIGSPVPGRGRRVCACRVTRSAGDHTAWRTPRARACGLSALRDNCQTCASARRLLRRSCRWWGVVGRRCRWRGSRRGWWRVRSCRRWWSRWRP